MGKKKKNYEKSERYFINVWCPFQIEEEKKRDGEEEIKQRRKARIEIEKKEERIWRQGI